MTTTIFDIDIDTRFAHVNSVLTFALYTEYKAAIVQ